MHKDKLLEIKGLKTSFFTGYGEVKAVRNVSFDVKSGEVVGIVGESGSGKSALSLSIMRLLPDSASIKEGEIKLCGENILKKTNRELQKIRGKEIAIIFQNAMSSLNPLLTIGKQIEEVIIIHNKMKRKEAKNKAIETLKLVGIPKPEERVKDYPHEFSGGMRQRVVIAMALACNPALIIADEPTTSLDVTIQAQIIELMKDLNKKLGTAFIFISHDLGIIAEICTRVIVMYGGMFLEEGTTKEIFNNPKHPYTKELLNARIKVDKTMMPFEGMHLDLLNGQSGCPFLHRCSYAMKICDKECPPYFRISQSHKSMCWLLHDEAPKPNE